jgi:hypothetical protein
MRTLKPVQDRTLTRLVRTNHSVVNHCDSTARQEERGRARLEATRLSTNGMVVRFICVVCCRGFRSPVGSTAQPHLEAVSSASRRRAYS